MQRAIISIGIQRTGGLPELMAAHESASGFAEWARCTQDIPSERIKLITDAKGMVSREQIFDEVEQIIQLGFVEQLIVYFSGHGVNSGLYEQWLLSRAPNDPGAAVNLRGSEMLARFCGISHVVFISDACRTAADSIQAQGIKGGEIFPNPSVRGMENPVDQYFAALVGNPAYEVKVVEDAVGRYRAAYSTIMLDALCGKVPSLMEDKSGRRLIRPRPLKKYLAHAIPDYMNTLGLVGGQTQQPDARIESDEMAWLSDLGPADTKSSEPALAPVRNEDATRQSPFHGSDDTDNLFSFGAPQAGPSVLDAAQPRRSDVELEAREELARILTPASFTPERAATYRSIGSDATTSAFERAIISRKASHRPDHFETQCGIAAQGARLISAGSRQAVLGIGAHRDVIQVNLQNSRRGANVLVRLEDGSAVVVPAFRGYITSLTFDLEGNLDDVFCHPSANTPKYNEWKTVAQEVNSLHAVIGAASSLGVFRFDDESQGLALLDRMRTLMLMDPTMAVYAAWAFHDRRMRTQVIDMHRYLEHRLGFSLFDVALLAFSLHSNLANDALSDMYPCVPMLTQGWAMLSSLQVSLPERLADLHGHLRPSLWTHFGPNAYKKLEAALC